MPDSFSMKNFQFDKDRRTILILGTVSVPIYLSIALMGDLRFKLPLFFALFACAFVAYSIPVFLETRNSGQHRESTPITGLIIIFAAIFRGVMLVDFPHLSDDIYRYLWDAHVWASGINPYIYAPSDATLSHLQWVPYHKLINHADIPTIYAPVYQFLFQVSYCLGNTILSLKIVIAAFEIGTIFILKKLLELRRLNSALVLIYAWNPLVILETAGSGHLDGVGVFFIMLTFYLWWGDRKGWAIVALALAVLTKFIALMLLPFYLLKLCRRERLKAIVIFLLVVVAAYLPFAGAGVKLVEALMVYTAKWAFNASIFGVVLALFSYVDPGMPLSENLFYSKVLLAAAFLALYGLLLYRYKRSQANVFADPVFIWLVLFGALCIISPTLHPWYLIWIIPALCFYPSRAWIGLSGLIIFSYWVLKKYALEGIWEESIWLKVAIFLPFYAMLFYECLRVNKLKCEDAH